MSDSTQEKMAQLLQEQQAQWGGVVTKALDSSMKLVELNLEMTKKSMKESTESVRDLLKVKSPDALFSVDQNLIQERLNQVINYAGQINAIASEFAAELSQVTQAQMTGNMEKLGTLSDAVKPAAASPGLFPDASAVQQGYEQWMDASKKMMDAFGQSVSGQKDGTGSGAAAQPKPAPRSRARTK